MKKYIYIAIDIDIDNVLNGIKIEFMRSLEIKKKFEKKKIYWSYFETDNKTPALLRNMVLLYYTVINLFIFPALLLRIIKMILIQDFLIS